MVNRKPGIAKAYPTRFLHSLITGLCMCALLLPSLVMMPGQALAAFTISGTVYRDTNANGLLDAPAVRIETGVAGITVTAYDPTGAAVATTTSGANGFYTLNIPGTTQVRVEFTGYQALGYRSAPHDPTNNISTSINFINTTTTLNFGVNLPGQYCQDNPQLATNCYEFGDQATGTNNAERVIVTFPYNSSGTAPAPAIRSVANQAGSTWGITYQPTTQQLFAAAYLKRHTGFGPGGAGTIYRIDTTTAATNATPFVTLNAGSAATIRPVGTDYLFDPLAFAQVGKMALGGMKIAEDESALYTVNLFDRRLYQIPLSGNPPVAGAPASYAIPLNPPNCTGVTDDVRPFAVQPYNGLVYVGMVCSAESTVGTAGFPFGDPSKLRAYVYTFNPAGGSFAGPVLNIPLNFARGCTDASVSGTFGCNANAGLAFIDSAGWRPWVSNFSPTFFDAAFFGGHPQPMLTGIAFDNGNMVLGFRDRFGDQVGYRSGSPDPLNNTRYTGITAGDTMRACANGAGGWTLENNGNCAGITTAGAGNAQGPGGGEYYWQDYFYPDHDEISLGGLTQVPGLPDVVSTVFDPILNGGAFTAGTRWFNNSTGATSRSYQIYANSGANPPPIFGKANGLGDLVALCNAAPLEIGNRVWYDPNQNGIQDAAEVPVPGVTVRLYAPNGTLLATALTDANGNYYFSNGTGTTTSSAVYGIVGFKPNTVGYYVRLDNPADYQAGGPLYLYILTIPFATAGAKPTVDSNGVWVSGYPQANVNTGGPGANDHTYDFGFYLAPTPTPTPTVTPTQPPPPPAATPTPPSGFITVRPSVTPATVTPSVSPSPTPSATITPTAGAGPGLPTTPPVTATPGTPPGGPGSPGLPNTGRVPISENIAESEVAIGWLRWIITGLLLFGGGWLIYRGRNRSGPRRRE